MRKLRDPLLAIFVSLLTAFAFIYLHKQSYNAAAALPVFVVLLLVSFFAFRNLAESKLLWSALFLKLLGTFAYICVIYFVSSAYGDCITYHAGGLEVAESLRRLRTPNLEFSLGLRSHSVSYVVGILYTIIGPTMFGGFLIFSWLSFIGMYLFYKAFKTIFPDANHKLYAYLVFFFPSIVLWTSQMGKDALMFFFLGLIAYSVALLLLTIRFRAILYLVLGLTGGVIIRPQVAVAVVVAGAIALPLMVSKRRSVSRLFAAGIMLIAFYIIITYTTLFMNFGPISYESVEHYLESKTQAHAFRASGSRFQSSHILSPKQLPSAVLTSLVRPFPWEVHNYLALISSLEGVLLTVLLIRYIRNIITAILSLRRNSYVVFILSYSVLLVIALSVIGNFGLLVRQRVQLLPFLFMLIAYRESGIAVRMQ